MNRPIRPGPPLPLAPVGLKGADSRRGQGTPVLRRFALRGVIHAKALGAHPSPTTSRRRVPTPRGTTLMTRRGRATTTPRRQLSQRASLNSLPKPCHHRRADDEHLPLCPTVKYAIITAAPGQNWLSPSRSNCHLTSLQLVVQTANHPDHRSPPDNRKIPPKCLWRSRDIPTVPLPREFPDRCP